MPDDPQLYSTAVSGDLRADLVAAWDEMNNPPSQRTAAAFCRMSRLMEELRQLDGRADDR